MKDESEILDKKIEYLKSEQQRKIDNGEAYEKCMEEIESQLDKCLAERIKLEIQETFRIIEASS